MTLQLAQHRCEIALVEGVENKVEVFKVYEKTVLNRGTCALLPVPQ